MSVLVLLESSYPSDRQRYFYNLVKNLPTDYNTKIAFLNEGTPSDHTYQMLGESVATKLCFSSSKKGFQTRFIKYLQSENIKTVVATQEMFNEFSVSQAMQECPDVKVIYMGWDSNATSAAAALSSPDTTYVACSRLVASKFMNDYDPLVIYGAAVEPETAGVNIRQEFRVPSKLRVMGFVGNVDLIDTDMLVECARRLKLGLIVCGTGNKIASIEHSKGPIKVFPTMPEYRMDWYKAFNCLVYPVKQAGFPSIPLEAIMSGIPVAMTPVSDFYSVLGNCIKFHGFDIGQMTAAVEKALACDPSIAKMAIQSEFGLEKFVNGWMSIL